MTIAKLLQRGAGAAWSVNDLVLDARDLLANVVGNEIEIATALVGEPWQVAVDQLKVEAIIIGLCARARDAMPAGGSVSFETRNVTLNAHYLGDSPQTPPGNYVLLAVTNNRSPSARTAAAPVLDLAWLPAYMRQCGGMARVYEVEGHGTTVRLYFPVVPEAAAVDALPKRRVLVVDDDDDMRALVVEQLLNLGYSVMSAADARAGLATLATEPPFDLVVSDVVMPWPMGGRELAEVVKKRWSNTAILFISGHTENTIRGHGLLESEVSWLAKPFRAIDLQRAVTKALEGR